MKKRGQTDPQELARVLREMSRGRIPSDVQGSYTGTAREDDKPVQDVDDL